jgi:hypothetical protein
LKAPNRFPDPFERVIGTPLPGKIREHGNVSTVEASAPEKVRESPAPIINRLLAAMLFGRDRSLRPTSLQAYSPEKIGTGLLAASVAAGMVYV